MKKFYILFSFIVVCISCSSDSSSVAVNPNLLKKVIVFDGTTNERHWNFNDDGFLENITTADGMVLMTYEYDNHNNVTTINNLDAQYAYNFHYNNSYILISYNITSVGSNSTSTFTFNSSNNTYYNSNSFTDSSGYTFNYNYTYYLNSERLLINTDSNLFPSDYENADDYYLRSTKQEFENGNIVRVDPSDIDNLMIDNIFTYDNKINPFKQALLPISRTSLSPTHYQPLIPGTPELSPFLSSNNNVLTIQSHTVYDEVEGVQPPMSCTYTFNSLDLPTEMHIQNGSTPLLMVKYYYQGDVFP